MQNAFGNLIFIIYINSSGDDSDAFADDEAPSSDGYEEKNIKLKNSAKIILPRKISVIFIPIQSDFFKNFDYKR